MLKRSNTSEFIKKSNLIHKDKYDYSKSVYEKSCIKVIIICPLHGEFLITPNNHLRGKGCSKCKFEKLSTDRVMSIDVFIKKSNKIHNNKYDYSKSIYGKNERDKIIIICPTHGTFSQMVGTHLGGHGCSKCNSSKGELKILKFLDDNKIKYETQKSFNDCINPMIEKRNGKLKFDFYIPSKNLLIEYDGEQHFNSGITRNFVITDKDVEYTKYRDNLKTEYADKTGIRLSRIKYTEFKNIEDILKKELI